MRKKDFMESLREAAETTSTSAFNDAMNLLRENIAKGMGINAPLLYPLGTRSEKWSEPIPVASPESKEDRLGRAERHIAHLEEELKQTKEAWAREMNEASMLRRQLDAARREVLRVRDEFGTLLQRQSMTAPPFVRRFIKFIIFACHPDRNPGRPEAVEVTKELLKLRGK